MHLQLFPVIPRTRNPLVQGVSGALTNATTGLSTTIDFSQQRTTTPDPAIVARVWMGADALPFFTPLRLRANVYDRYMGHVWLQSSRGYRDIAARDGVFEMARPVGYKRAAHVQQRFVRNGRLYLPTGTYAISGLVAVSEGPSLDTFTAATGGRESATFDIAMAREILPLRKERIRVVDYPVTPAVAALARQIAGNDTTAEGQARRIEAYMTTHFRYYMRPLQSGRPMTIDEFLLKDRRGHCEYFAAGMVALLSALDNRRASSAASTAGSSIRSPATSRCGSKTRMRGWRSGRATAGRRSIRRRPGCVPATRRKVCSRRTSARSPIR